MQTDHGKAHTLLLKLHSQSPCFVLGPLFFKQYNRRQTHRETTSNQTSKRKDSVMRMLNCVLWEQQLKSSYWSHFWFCCCSSEASFTLRISRIIMLTKVCSVCGNSRWRITSFKKRAKDEQWFCEELPRFLFCLGVVLLYPCTQHWTRFTGNIDSSAGGVIVL